MTSPSKAERLNLGCFCVTLDRDTLTRTLNTQVGSHNFAQTLSISHPTLFSNVPVFIPTETLTELTLIVDAVEAVVRLAPYREAVMSWAPPVAQLDFGPVGAFMSYDFHLTALQPKLIEVNTNAGGAFLNAALAEAQRACCESGVPFSILPKAGFASKIAEMFVREWRSQKQAGRPHVIAIVDDAPENQYLFPEFKLAKALLEEHGFETIIADAKDLRFDDHTLTIDGRQIDLVYNRLVDFSFQEPRHTALSAAYIAGSVVVTPNPHTHALFADKRNMTLLSNGARLREWGLEQRHLEVLRPSIPTTVLVTRADADALWQDRRNLFFKPARGYGSKAAYRGDKVTRKVWSEIIAGEYIAQSYAAPSTRGIKLDDVRTELKVDVRLYTFDGDVLLAAARLYQGQTTNMRTPGGGFAPLLEVNSPPKALAGLISVKP